MDSISLLTFLAITVIFAAIVSVMLKFTVAKYIPFLLNLPTLVLMVIIILLMFSLQGMGVPVNEVYAGFFNWLAKVLGGA